MGEENNNGILFYSDNIVRPVNDISYSRYELSYPDIVHVPNVNGELVIPEMFEKILKKLIVGLDEIKIDNYERLIVYNSFTPTYKYKVSLVLVFSHDSGVRYGTDKLSEIINTRFSGIYTDIDNFTFSVLRAEINQRNFDKEFFEFFTRK